MTTIKLAVLRHTRAKDGSYKIRISIGHKSETHYIVTKYRVSSLNNFVNGVVVGQPDAKQINIKLRQLLNEYDEKLERIPNAGEMSCEQLRNILRDLPKANNTATLQQMSDKYTTNLRNEDRHSTADLMESQLKRFYQFTNGDIFLAHITPRLIDDYKHHLTAQNLSPSYVSMLISPIGILVNYAIKMQYVKYDQHPFTFYHKDTSMPRDVDISIEDMRKIFHYKARQRKMQRTIDIFKLSYILGGMNMKDLLTYDFRNRNQVSYVRQKTKRSKSGLKVTQFSMPAEALPILDRWVDADTGLLDMHVKNYDTYMAIFNRSIKTVARNLGIDKPNICFYSARKSFVQHGFDLGISLEVLEYCIGQTMKANRPIFNYAKVMSKHADVAIRKILDNMKNPPSVTDEG